MTSFQGSSEFNGNHNNNNPNGAHTLETSPSVGRFPSVQTPSPLSFIGSAYSASSNSIIAGNQPGQSTPQHQSNLAQAQSQNREQGNVQRYYGNGAPQFNPAPTKNGFSK